MKPCDFVYYAAEIIFHRSAPIRKHWEEVCHLYAAWCQGLFRLVLIPVSQCTSDNKVAYISVP